MEIRRASADDAEIVSALNSEVQQVHADLFPDLFKPPSDETFSATLVRQLLADPATYIFIGYLDGEPVGYVYAQIIRRAENSLRYASERLFIHHISVKRDYQRHGVGEALIQATVNLAKEQGISTMALDVWSLNTKARAFFAAQGFATYNENMWLHLK